METIKHYSNFPATGVSLRQMVQFGEKPSTGKRSIGIESERQYANHIVQLRYLVSRLSVLVRGVAHTSCT